jgi:hypothetical protein
MHFQRFTVSDHGQLRQEIEQVRAELADAEARGEPLAVLELAAALGELLTTARDEAAARSVIRAYLPLALEYGSSEATGWLLLSLYPAYQEGGEEVRSMTVSQLFRIGGLALVLGAIVSIAHLIARSVITAGLDPVSAAQQGFWVPMSALGVLGAVLVLLGLPALYASTAGSTGWVGLAGVMLITLAWLFFRVFLSLYSLLVMPWLATQAPVLVAAGAPLPTGIIITFAIGLVAELAGSVLLAIPLLQGRIQPRWAGLLLPAAVLLRVAGNLIAPAGPANNLALNLLSNLGPMLLLGTLGYLGFRMWHNAAPADREGGVSARAVGGR